MEQDEIWSLYIKRKLDDFKKNVYNFYKPDKEESKDDWDKTMKRLDGRGRKDK